MRIASAVQMNEAHSNLNLNRQFLGTFKIGQILPVFHEFCVPGDKFSVKLNMFSRFLPLAVPSYVKLLYRTLSVFVPYHQVVDGYESYVGNQKKFKGVTTGLPKLPLSTWFTYLSENTAVATSGEYESGMYYDYLYVPSSGASTAYVLTAVGRYQDKLLRSLGLRIPKDYNAGYQTQPKVNITPLLAFAHAYNCYMSYSPNYNLSALSNVLETIKRSPNVDITSAQLRTILSSILLTYEESFVSSLWNSPYYSNNQNAFPYANNYNDVSESVIGDGNTKAVTYAHSTGAKSQTAPNTSTVISAAQIRLLLKFDDYFRRTNYAGSKDIEQIYSRFGVKIDDYKTRYPYFLNESAQEIAIGDVTSTADTTAAPIGAYAGKAIGSGNAGFNFDCKDYGMLITLAWFAPKPTYYQGIDKEYLRTEPFDFYNSELDQGFPSAVSMLQLRDKQSADVGTNFGYTQLYSEYLFSKDQIVGDFDRYEDYKPWHFGRDLNDLNTAAGTAQSDQVIYIPQQGYTLFERIFNVSNPDEVDQDSIMTKIDVRVDARRPMKDRVGKSGLGDGNLDIPALGSQIN